MKTFKKILAYSICIIIGACLGALLGYSVFKVCFETIIEASEKYGPEGLAAGIFANLIVIGLAYGIYRSVKWANDYINKEEE